MIMIATGIDHAQHRWEGRCASDTAWAIECVRDGEGGRVGGGSEVGSGGGVHIQE